MIIALEEVSFKGTDMNRTSKLNIAIHTIFALAAAACVDAHANVIQYTTQSAFSAASSALTTIDFSAFATSSYNYYGTQLSTQGVTFSNPAGSLFVFNSSFYGSSGNGPTQGGNYLNNNSDRPITVTFSQGVTAFSLNVADLFSRAQTSGSIVLSNGESFAFGATSSQYTFLGFTSTTAITGYTIDSGYYTVLDDVSFGKAVAVPEPASLALVGLGLLGCAALRRKRG
jgi:hypothetical protein